VRGYSKLIREDGRMIRSDALTRRRVVSLATAILAAVAFLAHADDPSPRDIEFNRDVRPILASTCFACHGPDSAQRKAGLRLDTEAGALADLGGRRAVVPSDLDASELAWRITAEDETERMPPADTGKRLSPEQIAILRQWIEQGASWQPHWSLIPPTRSLTLAVAEDEWPRNPIDRFILARLEREELSPSPEGDPATLIRRVTLDLMGLPPTPAEVDAFLTDGSPHAYEAVVDRLLASPRYGERMAARWLDAARYADTNGYQSDGERFMWRWRDWVIDALNRNMPFDRFTIEQLAGDLLPDPTLDQLIATGFNRNHRGNAEGGIIPEEYAVEYVADRVETTATVWMGLTIGCARCHDHKFDPITQKDYYRAFAYFNNVPEKGRAVKFGNSPPLIKAPTPDKQAQLAKLEQRLSAAERRFTDLGPELDAAQASWEERLPHEESIDWTITENRLAWFGLDGGRDELASLSFCDGAPAFAQGRSGLAAELDGRRYLDVGDVGDFGFDDTFSLTAWVYPTGGRGGTILSRMTDVPEADGYALSLSGGKLQVNLVKRWLDDALRVESLCTLEPDRWHHLAVTYDGSRVAEGVKIYVDGCDEPFDTLLDELNQSFKTKEPLRIGGGNGPDGRFHGLIDDVRVYAAALSPDDVAILATTETVSEIAARSRDCRSEGQARKLRACYLAEDAPTPIAEAWRNFVSLRKQRDHIIAGFPTTMIMQEMRPPRPSFVLIRGQYYQRGDSVTPSVPACLPPLTAAEENNRLGLARWLVSPEHPLTARVAVNRAWQMFFGTGLVKTLDDFGVQGESPSHPELLDWLATEFVRAGWDVKALHRLIVTSATYRQSSQATPVLRQRDPENRLLARGPRLRLSAEMIRDQALAASGLIVERLGGPSVKPYQPDGLWRDLAEIKDYPQDHGPDLYRRSLYTFWKRTVAPPAMMAFDASTRETCAVRESRTNTPLQALTLMNDVTYVEAARALAQRIMTEGGASSEDRITHAFRLVTSRTPEPDELSVLLGGYRDHLARFRADPAAATALIRTGESKPDESLDPSEHAAFTIIAALILNLDEAITKE
jgi:mono/diheme cytochrome c family protein